MTNEAGNEKGARRGRRPENPPELPNLARKLKAVVQHAFPEFGKWLGDVPDPRDATRCVYPIEKLLWTGIVSSFCGAQSRRHFRTTSDTPAFLANLNWLTGTSQETVPHPDTIAYLLGRLPSEALAELPAKCVHALMRSRLLDDSRLAGHYLFAIDGTGVLSFPKSHCGKCLTRTHKDGTTTHYHTVLESKLVTLDGLVFSVKTEFVENADPNASKQDCELNAFYRLLPALKEKFPRTRICLLLDGLFANDTVLKLCEEYDWKYIITFKEGSIPTAYADFLTLLRLQPTNRVNITHGEEMQWLAWANGLVWEKHRFDALQCDILAPDGTETRFTWLTNFELNPRNVEVIANHGGRCRWKIENQGFNAQKNGELHLEHPFGSKGDLWKHYYLLTQVAHMFQQLVYWWRPLRVTRKYLGAVYRFIAKFAQDMRTLMPPDEDTVEPAFQLRLDTT
jgi:hypothetical protein